MRSLLEPFRALLWRNRLRRARILLRFAEVEADGGRDLVRAAELTADPLLRRLYLAHARDEIRHAGLFRARGRALLGASGPRPAGGAGEAIWMPPGERGLDDVRVDAHADAELLAFLNLSERAAARDFAAYQRVLAHDPETRDVFAQVLRDEASHVNYTAAQLARIAPARQRRLLWKARLGRLGKGLLRMIAALAGRLGTLILVVEYFVVLGPFALLAKRAARRTPPGWRPAPADTDDGLERQY